MDRTNKMEMPNRILMGPGPSDVHPRVLRAMATPIVGYLDPACLSLMDRVMERLRLVFRTENRLTLPISGTGSAGMEAALVNFLERSDVAMVGVNGFFGQRMVDIVQRCGARAVPVEAAWGSPIEPEAVRAALGREPGTKLVAVVHAETSTGVLQPLPEIAEIVHRAGALLVVDAVTSLGGVPLEIDRWGIDCCYSGTQKCLSGPPGLAPLTLNEAAATVVRNRKTKVQSFYLDLTMIENYWGSGRVYHHTAPVSMLYALDEALALVLEEDLEARWARHAQMAAALYSGIEALGLELHVPAELRAPSLTTVKVPAGMDEAKLRRQLLEQEGIEIGGGLGELRGKVWRIGLMGESARPAKLLALLAALERLLWEQGLPVSPGTAVAAAAGALAPLREKTGS